MKRLWHRILCGRGLVVLGAVVVGLFGVSCGSSGSSSPHPEGAEAAETAATMNRTSRVGLGALLEFEVPETPVAPATLGAPTSADTFVADGFLGRTGVLGLLRRHAEAGATQGATTDFPCGLSGSLRLICNPIAGGSLAEVVSFGCTEDLLGIDLLVSGSFQVTSDDPDCEDGLDAATEVDALFSDYALITSLDGVELGRVVVDGSFSASGDTEPACVDGSGTVAGSFFIQSISQGISSTVTAQGLNIVIQNSAATCDTSLTVNGTLIIVDGEAQQSLTQSYTDFQVTTTPDGGTGNFLTIGGIASAPCLGDVLFETLTPLHVVVDGDCPSAGVVDVTVLDTDETSRIQYNPDGSVDIDFMVNGSVEISRPSCDDLSSPCS